jgi:hypothetical protein
MKSIVIIGAGNIGSRHLQSLADLDLNWEVTVIEPNPQSMSTAQSRYQEVMKEHSPKPIYCVSLDELPDLVDVCVLATPATGRLDLVREVVSRSECRNMILEKVVFQSVEDFAVAEDLFEEQGVNVWVNCPRRQWPVFKELKNVLEGSERIECHFSRSRFAMTCNAVHLIDVFQFLTGVDDIEIDGSGLSNPITGDTRGGYTEFAGVLKVTNSRGDLFTISGYEADDAVPPVMTVMSDKVRWVFKQHAESVAVASPLAGWEWKEFSIIIPQQSALTTPVVQELMLNGTCELATFSGSKKAHLPMLNAFFDSIERATGKRPERCNIT